MTQNRAVKSLQREISLRLPSSELIAGKRGQASQQAQFSRAACAITSIASGWRERTLSESAPQSSQAR